MTLGLLDFLRRVLAAREDMWLTGPDSMVNGANMGPIWGRQDPGGPHVVPMNFAIWGKLLQLNEDMVLWKRYL